MEKIRICMVGCGGMGGNHLSNLLTFDDVDFCGFCDLVEEKARGFAERAGSGRVYTDFNAMLAAEAPQLVYVCVPPDCHGAIELAVIEKGCALMVEKPVSASLSQAKKISARVAGAGIVSSVGFQMRYETTAEAAKKFTAEHKIVSFSCSRVHGAPGQPWWRDKKRSGGQLVEQTIHQLDILRSFLGEPETVFSAARRGIITQEEMPGFDTDDVSVTTVVFKNGAVGSVTTGCYTTAGAAFNNCTQFSARDCRMEYHMARDITIYDKDGVTVIPQEGEPGIRADRTLLDAVRANDPAMVRSDYAEGVRSLAFAAACNRSMETGLPVNVAKLIEEA